MKILRLYTPDNYNKITSNLMFFGIETEFDARLEVGQKETTRK